MLVLLLTLLSLAAWSALFGYAGRYISVAKGRKPKEGVALGILFGPPGLIVAAVLPTVTAAVPHKTGPSPVFEPPTPGKAERRNPWADIADDAPGGEFVDTVLPSRRSIRTASVVFSNEDDLMRRESRPSLPSEPDPTATRSRTSGPSRGLRA